LSLIENFDADLSKMNANIIDLKTRLGQSALDISTRRKARASELEEQIVERLKFLGIANSRFKVRIEQSPIDNSDGASSIGAIIEDKEFAVHANGFDSVEFLISANIGESEQPLADTASGGEISRIMLAIKSILANKDRIPTLVFDEIDSGISGAVARKTGLTMLELSDSHQIIAITHLPQIASLSTSHIAVSKFTEDGRTFVKAKPLSGEEKISEVARLLSGDVVTDASMESARELVSL
jgi:DNA repair protein RecN (Recombination protein N)